MSKKPSQLGSGAGAPVFGTARTNVAELEVEGVGTFPVERVATVGRSPESQVVLNVRSVSRHHARIFYEGGHFWIKDLESGNGTTVNGRKVKLQMLSDNDRLNFGEASAVFHTSTRTPGPAPLAHDPLEGSEGLPQDGTPTGGLIGSYPQVTTKLRTAEDEPVPPEAPAADLPGLRHQIDTLQLENDRLKKLVAQLERALADSNIRIRNLQQRLDQN